MRRFPLNTSHYTIVLSPDVDAKYSPLGENATQLTKEECPERVLMRSPLDTLHIPIVLSADPDAIYSPLDENTILFTSDSCPVRDCMNSPLDILHTSILSDPKNKYSPFGENAIGI